jgi:hypothetical protein
MESNYYIEPTFTGSISEINCLFLSEYDNSNSICNEDFLNWQYLKNPTGPAIITSCRSKLDNSLVGIYIVNPVNLVSKGKIIKSALSLNTFTRKDFRGLGLFPKMASICYEESRKRGIQCIIGFPNDNSYTGFIKKLDFKDLGEINQIVKLLKLSEIVKSYFTIFQKKALKIETAKTQLYNISNVEINILLDINNHEFVNFLKKYNAFADLTTFRSVEFLTWRYINHPTKKYFIYHIKDNESIKAYVIFSIESKKLKIARIVDFITLDFELGAKLLNIVTKSLYQNFKCSFIISSYKNKTLEFNCYKKNGFLSKYGILNAKKVKSSFIMKELDKNIIITDINLWNIVAGDGDMV